VSEQNIELVRTALEAYQLALLADGELDMALIDPQVEWDASRLNDMLPDLAEVYSGHEGVRMYWRRWFAAWSGLQFEIQDLRDSGDDVVALIRNQRQWGRHTGICTELPPYAQVFTIRDGILVRWRTFPDHESVLRAVGLRSSASARCLLSYTTRRLSRRAVGDDLLGLARAARPPHQSVE
jgi:ketosteroid isomerase-like protein